MTFDPSIAPAHYVTMLGTDNARSQSINQSSNDIDNAPDSMAIHSRYARRGLNMLETEVFSAYKFHQKISEARRAEEYTREITKAIQRVNRAYD